MNVFHSRRNAPNPLNLSDNLELGQSRIKNVFKDSGTGKISKPNVLPPERHSKSQPVDLADYTAEDSLHSEGVSWPSDHRTELLHSVDETSTAGKKRTSSKVSPHPSTAAKLPPPKKLDRRHRSRQELHSYPTFVSRIPDDKFRTEHSLVLSQGNQRPSLPFRLSSSEVRAEMLSKAHNEDTGKVTTLKLARGSMNVGTPSRPAGQRTPSGTGRNFSGSSRKARTPDAGERRNELDSLDQLGVIELLEQDDRPTFILDLSNPVNYEPGPLAVAYANASLRASSPILDVITGRAGQVSPGLNATMAFSDFKAWSISYVKDHRPLDVSMPSFYYSGSTWNSSSLRKRFRVIRASPSSRTHFSSNPPSLGFPSSTSLAHKENEPLTTEMVDSIMEEPQDYFGRFSPALVADERTSMDTSRTHDMSDEDQKPRPTIGMRIKIQGDSRGSDKISRSVHQPSSTKTSPNSKASNYFEAPSRPDTGFFDWTRLPDSSSLPRHIQFTRSIDWASTPLGPMEQWPADLRSMCNLIMASPHPAAMYWGPELIAIYNEAYILLAGQKHPRLMGQRYRDAWAEIWDSIEVVFRIATATGEATMKDDDCLFIHRAFDEGQLEETYFSWSIIPLVGSDGSVVGLYNPAFEKTRRKVAERRMLTLREIGEKTASARDLKSFWQQCLQGIEYNEFDSPFVLLYSITDDLDSDSSSMHSNSVGVKQCVLEGTLGVPEGHPVAAPVVDLRNGNEYVAGIFREAIKDDRPILLSTEDGTLDAHLLKGFEWRGFGDPCKAAVCCPIHLVGGETTLGFLVMGVNPRRPYDDDYSLYVQLLSRQLATAMASVVLFEEEIARGKRAARLAAQDRIELSKQLAIRTQEAVESETKFTRMAEFAPVGIFIADSAGEVTYINDKWYEIAKLPKGSDSTHGWLDSIKEEDREGFKKLWSNLVDNGVSISTEVRLKSTWIDQNGVKADTWVLASAFPEKGDDGKVQVIFGSITDISQQKWAEYFEKRRMEEAVEMKRQQENFIDITSHEMRNPLSAILQCADEISNSMTELQVRHYPRELTTDLVKGAVEASGIIALCAQHQKRIVDDILTLSKLDSALLLVTPCDVMPISVVQKALKMFDGEVHQNDIKLNFNIDPSMAKLRVECVKLDPSRLLQVLINLTTNAIKFTTTQEKRVINVTMGASLERPAKEGSIVSYFPPRSKKKDLTKSKDWGTGDKIYLHFAVQDTGRGLSDDEKKLLFIRFSQASPRTHVQYGGSGLGLFISRELVELQGGEIGVASKAGEGSTFAFYIKARRSTMPTDGSEDFHSPGSRKLSSTGRSMPSNLKNSRQNSETSQQPLQSPKLTQRPSSKSDFKILIVEDNLINQQVLSKQLRNIGCVVHVANHGGECLDRLKDSTFWKGNERTGLQISVILMDQEMPVMDGLTCTKEIRKLEKTGDVTSHVPIIAVTANARSEQIDTALDIGMVCPNFVCQRIWAC